MNSIEKQRQALEDLQIAQMSRSAFTYRRYKLGESWDEFVTRNKLVETIDGMAGMALRSAVRVRVNSLTPQIILAFPATARMYAETAYLNKVASALAPYFDMSDLTDTPFITAYAMSEALGDGDTDLEGRYLDAVMEVIAFGEPIKVSDVRSCEPLEDQNY